MDILQIISWGGWIMIIPAFFYGMRQGSLKYIADDVKKKKKVKTTNFKQMSNEEYDAFMDDYINRSGG